VRIPRILTFLLTLPAPSLTGQQDQCLVATVEFDTGTLEQLLDDPAAVLVEEDAFWEREPAQRFVRSWSEGTGVPIDYAQWRGWLRSLEALSATERGAHPLPRTAERIVEEVEAFLARAMPHLCAFLPSEATLDIGIHFTAFVPPRSFVSGGVVINVAARAYYVVGADMARTIEAHLGREALVMTIRDGPASFVRTYNGLVTEPERIRLP
jgi:hypothetical protein